MSSRPLDDLDLGILGELSALRRLGCSIVQVVDRSAYHNLSDHGLVALGVSHRGRRPRPVVSLTKAGVQRAAELAQGA